MMHTNAYTQAKINDKRRLFVGKTGFFDFSQFLFKEQELKAEKSPIYRAETRRLSLSKYKVRIWNQKERRVHREGTFSEHPH
jgi:hypothetical protein